MAKDGSCLFRIGYFFYTRTKVGYYYHQRDIAKAREKYPDGQTHSVVQPKQYNDLKILPFPILLDNYSYIVTDDKTNTTIVVDPGDAEPVYNYLKQENIIPQAVLVTHKHWDHSGGNAAMKGYFPGIKIYGGANDNVPNVTNTVNDGETLEFGNLKFSVQVTPGHTVGHVVYLLDGSPFGTQDSLFSGDHLFLSGCGRMFEGSAATMLKSLDNVSEVDKNTLVWPGHEYADDNLDFACHIDPDNADAKNKFLWVKDQRNKRLCTCPSTMEEELAYNPFLRTKQESVLKSLGMVNTETFQTPDDRSRSQALAEIRHQKDHYKYKL